MTMTPSLVPTPTLLITGSPVDESFHTGLHITFTGRAEFNTAVDTSIIVGGVWTKTSPFSKFNSDTRVTISAPVQVQNTPNMVYETTLTINTLDMDRGDSGDYNLALIINTTQPFILGTTATTTRNIEVLGECGGNIELFCYNYVSLLLMSFSLAA